MDVSQGNETIEVAPNGDVILVVGPELLKIRVHSLVLGIASKPFAAMFKPGWNEGDAILHQSNAVEVPLPDDSAITMHFICAILHHQNMEIPEELPAYDVLRIAVAADKYDCILALKFASVSWLDPREKETGDMMTLVAAAYLFRNTQRFREITKTMILNLIGSYLALSCDDRVESIIGWRMYCDYSEKEFGRMERLSHCYEHCEFDDKVNLQDDLVIRYSVCWTLSALFHDRKRYRITV